MAKAVAGSVPASRILLMVRLINIIFCRKMVLHLVLKLEVRSSTLRERPLGLFTIDHKKPLWCKGSTTDF